MAIPTYPYTVRVTYSRGTNNIVRQDYNSATLPAAVAVGEQEKKNPTTKSIKIMVILEEWSRGT